MVEYKGVAMQVQDNEKKRRTNEKMYMVVYIFKSR